MNITTNIKKNDYRAYNEKTKKYYVDTKHVQSAMVQGWNKFCLTGGIIEYSAKLPGTSSVGGLWPACKSIQTYYQKQFLNKSYHRGVFKETKCTNRKRKPLVDIPMI